ncbi:Probable prefoldin subunit 3 [Serendipita indica DSM 11827]|nr:Probable prefoldin subunit 3 [Serendipita indica DSM 11827]
MATVDEASVKIEENPRGIPRAPFVQDVEKHIGGPEAEVESSIKQFQEAIAKYKYMESNLSQRRKGLEEKIPDIKKTLAMGDGIDDPMTTTFELNDTLWAEASIEQIDEVYLWLGANVMLAYPIQEAITLLTAKLQAAQRNHKGIVDDLEFLREQITIMEVNTARVYNYDVRRRREKKASEDK